MWRAGLILCLMFLWAGCATRPAAPRAQQSKEPPAPATQAAPDNARLALHEIPPPLTLPAPRPSTRPSADAPLEAVELFARARGLMLEGKRPNAIRLLKRAIELDPDSFELHYALGEAELGRSASDAESIAAFEQAAAIRPDHLDVHLQLGRQYLNRDNLPKALEHLRLATLTSEYRDDAAGSTLCDLILARTLQRLGYDRAALQQYVRLEQRLRRPSMSDYQNPDLMYLISRPESLELAIGDLHEKLGDLEAALREYASAAERSPGDFELQAKVARALAKLGRREQATEHAASIVRRFRANTDSIKLLREVYATLGFESDVAEELRRLYDERPEDRAILFALADVLNSSGRGDEALALMERALIRNRYDLDVLKRVFDKYRANEQTDRAALLLINASAARPDLLADLDPLLSQLLRVSQKNRLRVSRLQELEVPPESRAARLYWLSQVAGLWNRHLLARNAIEQAVRIHPPFPPAYRAALDDIWARSEWSDEQKIEASQELIRRAQEQDQPALAAELRGLTHLQQEQPAEAAKALAEAIRLGGDSADLQFTYAAALRQQGNNPAFEQTLWKLIRNFPTYPAAYSGLFNYYVRGGATEQAMEILGQWLAADPTSVDARLLQALVLMQARQLEVAEKVLLKLVEEEPDHGQVLATLRSFYLRGGQVQRFIDLLQQQRTKQPENRAVVEELLSLYAEEGRLAEAMKVLDETRAAVGEDPDLLYYLAHLYTQIDQKQMTEQILQEVIRIDPRHAAASNDLGYTWADEGRNLERAERLIRVAVEAEPDNESFLDSLAWVLYKRGKFAEARKYLEEAIGPASFPDPVVLDHLGDVLYRLGDTEAAQQQWERAYQRLEQQRETLQRLGREDEEREDLKKLRLSVQQKLKQLEAGQPVTVAPVAADAGKKGTQAKN